MDIATQMLIFARAVQEGGFSAAARALELTPSAVSKQISRLETRLGVRLLNRTTRHISLTDEGRLFYERSARIATEISEAEEWVTALHGNVRGTLRVASTVAFAKNRVLPLIPEFLSRYPELRVILEVTDRTVDLVDEGVDVAIRFTEQMTDPSLVARRLAINRRIVCAAPSYLEAHGVPQTPDDLMKHNCLMLYTVTTFNDWEFEGPEGSRVLHVSGNFETNSADTVYYAVLAGLGIARLSTYLVGADVKAGRLVHLLPAYVHEKASILAVYPHRRHMSPKVRAFIDFLVEKFTPVPPWEAD
ncbi:MAG: LysR family transcriptional regulator [Sulfuricaulis sp.]|uniref:LysR family transcriptional regulator n=1 Tax=Sulfuricaulis sp. TaxID=2003553 RepID=UPI0034A5BD10